MICYFHEIVQNMGANTGLGIVAFDIGDPDMIILQLDIYFYSALLRGQNESLQ